MVKYAQLVEMVDGRWQQRKEYKMGFFEFLRDRLMGKVVLITGGTGNVGYATAKAFLECDCHVAVTDWRGPMEEIPAHNPWREAGYAEIEDGDILFVQGDVGSDSDVQRVVKAVVDQHGRIDCLINNAAIGANIDVIKTEKGKLVLKEQEEGVVMQSALHCRDEDTMYVLNINLMGAMRFVKYAVPHMPPKESSCIISVTSEFADGKVPYAVGYTAAKAGLAALARNWAHDPKIRPRRSLVLSPGPMGGPMCWLNPNAEKEIAAGTLSGRCGDSDEAALAMVCMFACHYMNDSEVKVDGGFLMRD